MGSSSMKQPSTKPQTREPEQMKGDGKRVQKAPAPCELKDEQLDKVAGGTASDWRCHIHPI